MEVASFKEIIRALDRDVVDLTWTGELFKYESFRDLHAQGSKYLSEVIAFLQDPDATEQQKMVAALAMQKLDLSSYVHFLTRALALFQARSLSPQVFEACCFPSYSWNRLLAENFTVPEVRFFLNQVLDSPLVAKKHKEYIQTHILTGKAQHHILYLQSIGEIS